MPGPILAPSITSVASSPACRSVGWCGIRSICEYCLAASTRLEIRPVLSAISASSVSVSTVYASHRSAGSRKDGATASATRSRSSGPSPAATKTPARSQGWVTPRSSSQSPSASSRSDRSSADSSRVPADPGDELLLQPGQRAQHLAVDLALGQQRELVPHAGEPVAQRRGGPRRGGRGVVQLVGQAGRQLAQGEQPLPLADQLGGVALPDEQPLEQVDGHRVPLPEDRGEGPGGQREEPAVGDRADRRRVPLLEPVAEVELHRAGVRRRGGRSARSRPRCPRPAGPC